MLHGCSVTLGDEEAKRRGGQKTVRERSAPPTFGAAIEMLERQRWIVHDDVAKSADALLAGSQACCALGLLQCCLCIPEHRPMGMKCSLVTQCAVGR